ncbi:hypothetical protein ACFFU9_13730 [Mariniflexile ostreae]|uniref:Uncharacterized protein n=1 Tax=Mariniflexile ostreae TaxID=1520892 RepID=A0ABV5FEB9_9FLAO
MKNIEKLSELIKKNKEVQKIVEKRNLKDGSPIEESIIFTQGLAAGFGLTITKSEIEEYLTKAILVTKNNDRSLTNLPKEFLDIKVGVINKSTHMCQSCVLTSTLVNDEIFEKIRKL